MELIVSAYILWLIYIVTVRGLRPLEPFVWSRIKYRQ